MKKSLIALAALAFASSAFAGGTISIEREHFDYRNSNAHMNGTAVLGSYQISEKHLVTIDGRYQFGRMNDSSTFNTAEVGLRKDFSLNDSFTIGLRAGVGRMYPEGAASISYYVIDPTITYTATPKLFLTVGIRHRDNFAGGSRTKSPMAWADYLVTDKDMVSLSYTRIIGAVEAKSLALTYTRLF